jgi:hypothetical protein
VVPLADTAGAYSNGASWCEDGGIVMSAAGRGLLRIPAGGGTPETIAGLASGELFLARPQILPGGKAILFESGPSLDVDKFAIEVLTLADRHRKIVARGGASPRYLAASSRVGYLIYVNKATLFAIPFDLDKLETRGTAVPVLDDVAYNALTGTAQFDFSSAPSGHGTLVYRRASGGASGTMTLQWVYPSGGTTGKPTGKNEQLRAKPDAYESLRLSPDGKRVALTVAEGGREDVWVYDQQRDAMARLTFGGFYRYPMWSPDGQYVVFMSYGHGIFQARADGAGQPQPLTHTNMVMAPRSFTPDGKRLAYDAYGAGAYQIGQCRWRIREAS